jgi:hypothetical protein
VFCCSVHLCALAHTHAADDRRALNAVFHALDGPNWQNKAGWATDAPLGTCSALSGSAMCVL